MRVSSKIAVTSANSPQGEEEEEEEEEEKSMRELLGWVEREAARFPLRHATQTLRAMRRCGVLKCSALTALKLRRAQASYGRAAAMDL